MFFGTILQDHRLTQALIFQVDGPRRDVFSEQFRRITVQLSPGAVGTPLYQQA